MKLVGLGFDLTSGHVWCPLGGSPGAPACGNPVVWKWMISVEVPKLDVTEPSLTLYPFLLESSPPKI